MEPSADRALKIPLVTDHSGGFGTSTGKSFKELSDMAIIKLLLILLVYLYEQTFPAFTSIKTKPTTRAVEPSPLCPITPGCANQYREELQKSTLSVPLSFIKGHSLVIFTFMYNNSQIL